MCVWLFGFCFNIKIAFTYIGISSVKARYSSDHKSIHIVIVLLIIRITEAIDRAEHVIGMFFRFSKAFGIVDHGILFNKRASVMNTLHIFVN